MGVLRACTDASMHSSTPLIVLCLIAIFCAEEICGEAPNDNWQTIFSEASLWNENWPQTRVVYDIEQDPLGLVRRASTYQRSPMSSQTKNRVLFVDFDGLRGFSRQEPLHGRDFLRAV